MADSNSSVNDPTLEQADRAAEALARSNKESLRPEVDPARESALDNAFAEASKSSPPADADPNEFGRENAGVKPPVEGTPETKPAEEVKPAAEDQKPAEEVKPAAEEPKTKTLLDELVPDATKTEVKPAPAEDPYNVKLRSDASPKTRETVEQLKTIAREREAAALKQAEEARAQVAEKEARIKELEAKTVPDEIQNELKELRAFRAQFDAERDPEFRQRFDAKVETNYAAVYAKLQSHGLNETEIGKLKAMSQADRDSAIERLASKLTGLDRRMIEAKLLDNVNLAEERQKALEETRRKADEILKQKSQAPAEQAQKRIQEIATLVQPELARLPWIHAKEIPANAAPEEKKRLEADNARALELQEQLKAAIVDDSPVTRARAALSVPLARHYSSLYVSEKARADALQAKLDAISQAGATSRTARAASSVPSTPQTPSRPKETGEALDDLFNAVTGSR